MLLLPLGGCFGTPLQADFESIDPQERTLAIAKAVKDEDRAQIPALITMLDSSDPAARMLAISTLYRWTGQTLDYDYAGPVAQRQAAADRWESWARDHGLAGDEQGVRARVASP